MIRQDENDPACRQSDQIATAVRKNGVPVWYLTAKDEGHGFQSPCLAQDALRELLVILIA